MYEDVLKFVVEILDTAIAKTDLVISTEADSEKSEKIIVERDKLVSVKNNLFKIAYGEKK